MSDATITLVVLFFAIIMFTTEKLPLSVTAVVTALSLVLFGVITPTEAFLQFANKNIILIVSMLIIGSALFETGMADRIGNQVKRFTKTESQLAAVTMLLCGLMSAFLSNTGTAVVLIPVIVGMSIGMAYCSKRMLMPIAISCSIGGVISLVGQPANLLGNGFIQEHGHASFSFFSFAVVGIPMLLISIVYYVVIGQKLISSQATLDDWQPKESEITVPLWKQVASLITLIITVIAMVLGKDITGFDLHVVSAVGAVSLVIFGVINEKQAMKAIDMGVVCLLAGMLAMAVALGKSGAGAQIAHTIVGLLGEEPGGFALMASMLILSAIMTNIMSNTATGALLIPISYNLALEVGVDPVAIVFAVIIGSSQCFVMVMGQPANPLAISASKKSDGSGGLTFMDFVKVGAPLAIINICAALAIIPIFFHL